MRVMRWRNGALSGSDLANEPGLGSSRTYQPGEMPMPSKPKPGLTRMHQEMNSEAASSGSPLRAAVPPKRAKVEQKVQTNKNMQDLDGTKDELERTKRDLDEMTKSMLSTEEDSDMWKRLFEDCNKKQGQEIERLKQDYKEQSERMALTTAVEKLIPARSILRGQSPMELLTPREMSQTTETRLPTAKDRVTIPDPSDTLGDPVVEQTVRKLIETAGRLVANKNAPGSGVTAPYGTIDDTGRVRLSQTVIRKGISDVTPLMESSKAPERRIQKMPAKKVSRVIDVQKNNQLRYNFTGVNFNDHQRRRTHGSTRGRGSSSGYATRDNRTWGPNSRASSTGNRQTSNERPTQGTYATGRGDSGNRRHASPGRSHVGQGGNTHGNSDCRDAPNTEPLTRCDDTQAGHSRDATAMATALEPLNRSLETFLTRLSKTNERSEKSRRVFKKPRCYKDESDGCIDTWIEVMKLHFEEEDLSERQECSALTSNLEETALNCVMAKKQYQRDTAEKIFEILLNRFGSGVQGHQAMMRFEKRRQREDESIDKFLDDLEMLRRRSQPDESNRRMNLAVASKFIDGVKNDELRTRLATHYTPLSTNAPTPEELRLKSKEYLLLKPPSRFGYYKNNYGNFNNGPANQGNNWYKPRDDMDKRRSCGNCSSTDHHVSACPTYKQCMKAIGFSLEDQDASEVDHEDCMRGLIAKFSPRCFFCNLEGHFKSDCLQFWDAVADIKHPRHEEALSGVKASKARLLSEAEARRKDKPQELATKKMQAVTEETREPEPVTAADDFKIDYRAAARIALNRVQQELVTKEIEQKVKLELEIEKLQEQLNTFEATEVEETKAPSSFSMKLNVISGQRFGMVPQGSKIQSIISVAGHQVIRNLSEPSEFTLMHLDTYADYMRQVEARTESRAVRALLTTGGPRTKKLHGRYLDVYGPHQVMLNVDGISIYTRTYVTTDSDQIGQIYLGEDELKVRRIGHDAMMEQDMTYTNERKSESQGFWTQER